MGRNCSIHMRNEKYILIEKPEAKRAVMRRCCTRQDNFERTCIACDPLYWTQMDQDRDRRRRLVNKVMNLRVYKRWGISRLVERLLDAEEVSQLTYTEY
jgi:hypothetical protein